MELGHPGGPTSQGLAFNVRSVGSVLCCAVVFVLGAQFRYTWSQVIPAANNELVHVPLREGIDVDSTGGYTKNSLRHTSHALLCPRTPPSKQLDSDSLKPININASSSSSRRLLLFPIAKRMYLGEYCVSKGLEGLSCNETDDTDSSQQLYVLDSWKSPNLHGSLRLMDASKNYKFSDTEDIWNRFCSRSIHLPAWSSSQSIDKEKVAVVGVGDTTIRVHSSLDSNHSIFFEEYSLKKSRSFSLEKYQRHEYYSIRVDMKGFIYIDAYSNVGVQHALASLSQLLSSPVPIPLPILIEDWPSSMWRGLQIDTARHFQPILLLKRTIDALEASKMNVLHIHFTDSQSFPILLEDTVYKSTSERRGQRLPLSELAINGTFCTDKVYTLSDLQSLVAYALARNIEVVPEIDVPAHTLSWGSSPAFADIVVKCPFTSSVAETPHNIFALDPSNPQTIEVVEAVLEQIAKVFPSPYLHIGGDEVDVNCWRESKNLSAWAKERNWRSDDVFRHFEQQVFSIVRRLGKVPIVWQGVWDLRAMPPGNNYNSTTTERAASAAIVQPWKCWSGLATRTAAAAAKGGHPVVMAACWYLDYNQDWTSYLAADPIGLSKGIIEAEDARIKKMQQQQQQQNALRATAKETLNSVSSNSSFGINKNANSSKAVIMLKNSTGSNQTLPKLQRRRLHLNAAVNEVEPPETIDIASIPTGLFGPVNTAIEMGGSSSRNRKLLEVSIEGESYNDFFLGGEGNMWTERVDHSNLECKLWPRTIAVAARLWGVEPWQRAPEAEYMNSLSIEDSRHVMMSFIHARAVLARQYDVDVAPLTFHYASSTSSNNQGSSRSYSSRGIVPVVIRKEDDALQKVESATNIISLLKGSGGIPTGEGNFHITSVCMGIPEIVQRPTIMPRLSLVQLNIAEGSTGERGTRMLQWLQRKAAQGVIAIGLCELNGWQELSSPSASTNLVENVQLITARAANAGFSHSYIMTASVLGSSSRFYHPYHIGLVSTLPFEVRGEYGPPTFQRGVLHVYFRRLDLHLLIAHLHAHDSRARELETTYIIEHIVKVRINDQRARVAIMGDLNSLSRVDAKHHEEEKLLDKILDSRLYGPQIAQRYSKKYLSPDKSAIAYAPLDTIMRAGFADSCMASCITLTTPVSNSNNRIASLMQSIKIAASPSDSKESISKGAWSQDGTDAFSRCMQTMCRATQPTLFNPEWHLSAPIHPLIRLDYIFLSDSIIEESLAAAAASAIADHYSDKDNKDSQNKAVTSHNNRNKHGNGMETCFSNLNQVPPKGNFIRRHPNEIVSDPLFPLINRLLDIRNLSSTTSSLSSAPSSSSSISSSGAVTISEVDWRTVDHPAVYAGVEVTAETAHMSDHYPVFASWITKDPIPLY